MIGSESELEMRRKALDTAQVKLERERLEFEQKRLQRMTVAVSVLALVISAAQVVLAVFQSRLTAAQTVERLIPHLQKEETRDLAWEVMREYVGEDVVIALSNKLKVTVALDSILENGTKDQKDAAKAALDGLADQRKTLIEKMFSDNKSERISATTELQLHWRSDPNVVSETIAAAMHHVGKNSDADVKGMINALVLLKGFSVEVLRANEIQLLMLFDGIKTPGPQALGHINVLRDKLSQNQ